MTKLSLIAVAGTVFVLLLMSSDALAQSCESHSDCDDGFECNGRERCHPVFGCVSSSPFRFLSVSCNKCTSDAECDDGAWCNGNELCAPDDARADPEGCVQTDAPCLFGVCDESVNECFGPCLGADADKDGDGFNSDECGGADCDDNDPGRYPGNLEVCDAENVDEDCNPLTFGETDADGDGFIDDRCCNEMGSELVCGDDCSDSRRDMHPLGFEICDHLDNDCNGVVDDRTGRDLYPDNDQDGFGDPGADPVWGCPPTPFFSPIPGDCDDTNPAIVPGAMVCKTTGDTSVLICGSDGFYRPGECPAISASVCVELPNGTGDCEPQKCIEGGPLPVPTD